MEYKPKEIAVIVILYSRLALIDNIAEITKGSAFLKPVIDRDNAQKYIGMIEQYRKIVPKRVQKHLEKDNPFSVDNLEAKCREALEK